jgi:hypothetical protein
MSTKLLCRKNKKACIHRDTKNDPTEKGILVKKSAAFVSYAKAADKLLFGMRRNIPARRSRKETIRGLE